MANDGRRDPRKPTVLQIRFKNATIEEFVEKHSRDISRGGIFIKMKSPFPSGTLIKFDIRIADDSMIHGVGRVVWRRSTDEGKQSPAGMGVKFIKLDEKSRSILSSVLAEKGPDADDETPLFDDALPKPKPTGMRSGHKSISLPKPSSSEKSRAMPPRPTAGVSLEDDTKKVLTQGNRSSDKERIDDIADENSSMVVAATATPGQSAKTEGGDNFLAGSDDKFSMDVDSALEAALPFPEGQDEISTRIATNPISKDAKRPPVVQKSATDAPQMPFRAIAPEKEHHPPSGRKRGGAAVAAAGIALLVCVVGGSALFFLFREKESPPEAPPPEPPPAATTQEEPAQREDPPPAEEPPPPENKAEEPQAADEETGDINIVTIPAGAVVRVNDETQSGVTPMMLMGLPAKEEIEITARLFGYLTQTRKVTLKAEEQQDITFKMKPALFRLEISSSPSGAKIFIDDYNYGKTPRTIRPKRMPASLTIKLVKDGYEPVIRSIKPANWTENDDQLNLVVEANLIKESSPSGDSKQPSSGAKTSSSHSESGKAAETPKPTPTPTGDVSAPPTAPPSSGTEPGKKTEATAPPEPKEKPVPAPISKPEGKAESAPEKKPAPAEKTEEKPTQKEEPKAEPEPETKPKKSPETPQKDNKGPIEENPF
jgi:uncharacterized protein (TIGR02266 family)